MFAPVLLLALQAAQPAACPTPVAPPAALSGWRTRRPITAARDAARAAPIAIGTGADARLLPAAQVSYRVAPEKAGAAGSHGGVFAFTVAAPARYRVALGAGAWVDVVSGTRTVASVAHGHGPACTGIAKMVDFDLKPGRYLLQVAGNAMPVLPILVARVPR